MFRTVTQKVIAAGVVCVVVLLTTLTVEYYITKRELRNKIKVINVEKELYKAGKTVRSIRDAFNKGFNDTTTHEVQKDSIP
jgi:ribonuclease I